MVLVFIIKYDKENGSYSDSILDTDDFDGSNSDFHDFD